MFFSISLTVIFEGEFHSLVREEVFVVVAAVVVIVAAAAAAAVLVVASVPS